MTEFGVTPYITVSEFKKLGYKIVIFPVTALRASIMASKQVLEEIMKKGTQKHLLGKLMSRKEFYELIMYDEYEKLDLQLWKKI
jgi:methylisocitrate lyase